MRRSIWFWLLIVVLVVVLLGIIFGGYRKGTRSAPAAPSLTSSVVVNTNSLAAYAQAARELA
jgi:cytochrome c biogenesis protein ResB